MAPNVYVYCLLGLLIAISIKAVIILIEDFIVRKVMEWKAKDFNGY